MRKILTTILISLLHTVRSFSLLTHILFNASLAPGLHGSIKLSCTKKIKIKKDRDREKRRERAERGLEKIERICRKYQGTKYVL